MCERRDWAEEVAVGGALFPHEEDSHRGHLGACAECREAVARLREGARRIEDGLAAWRVPAALPARFAAALSEAIAAAPVGGNGAASAREVFASFNPQSAIRNPQSSIPLRRFVLLRSLSMAAAAALLVSFTFLFWSRQKPGPALPSAGALQAAVAAHRELDPGPASAGRQDLTLIAFQAETAGGQGAPRSFPAVVTLHGYDGFPAAIGQGNGVSKPSISAPFPPGAEVRLAFLTEGENAGPEVDPAGRGAARPTGILMRTVFEVEKIRALAKTPLVQLFLRSPRHTLSLVLPAGGPAAALPVKEKQRAVLTVAAAGNGAGAGSSGTGARGADPWGRAYRLQAGLWIRAVTTGNAASTEVVFAWRESAGPDGKFGTDDDVAETGGAGEAGSSSWVGTLSGFLGERAAQGGPFCILTASALGQPPAARQDATLAWTPPGGTAALKMQYVDPWGTPYRYRSAEAAGPPAILSAGPDRRFGTADDLVVQ